MERILILGCSCAGKSTLARAMGEKTGIPVVHLDKLWWTGNWENVTREVFDARLAEELAKPRWIIDGNYDRTIEIRLQHCDTAVYFDFSRWTCLWGMLKRVLSSYGKVRPDMGGNCAERFDWEFIGWIWNFNREKREKMLDLLNNAPGVEAVILKNRREVRRFLDGI